MVNFIICDDNSKDFNKIVSMIDKFMMRNDLQYKKHEFHDYDDDFLRIISKKMPSKIYILDIEAPSRSGIDIARIIRTRDYNSALIFVTGHEELGQIILKKNFAYLAFINKFDELEKHFMESLEDALKRVSEKKIIKFKDGAVTVNLEYDDILYFFRDGVERKTIIKYDDNELKVNTPLCEIKKMLTKDFVKTHKSCIVNKNRIIEYNKAKKIITFDTGEEIDIVAKKFNGELV